MRLYQIWREGSLMSGDEGIPSPAELVGSQWALSFKEACERQYGKSQYFDPENLTYFGCRLFSTEKEARRLFG
jgi:hypothetical protein